MAPSTPPPPSNVGLAAFTIASTASLVISPRTSANRGSGMLWFMDEAEAAGILVEWTRVFHGTRLAVEGKCFRLRIFFPPFGKRATDAAHAGHVKTGGEFAYVMENQEAAGDKRGIPKIELGQGRSVFV